MTNHDDDSLHRDLALRTAAAVADAVLEVLGPDRATGKEHLEAFLDGRALLRVTHDECTVLTKPEGW